MNQELHTMYFEFALTFTPHFRAFMQNNNIQDRQSCVFSYGIVEKEIVIANDIVQTMIVWAIRHSKDGARSITRLSMPC